MEKEFLYVGCYTDTDGNFILKVGTTKDLERRRKEHTRNYHRAKNHTMPPEQMFEYLWSLALSKYNTFRYEDRTIQAWKEIDGFEYVRNDRFVCHSIPEVVQVKIKKIYEIPIQGVDKLNPLVYNEYRN